MSREPKSEALSQLSRGTKSVLLIALFIFIGMVGFGATKFWTSLMCGPQHALWRAADVDWSQPGAKRYDADPRTVYDQLIAELEADGYTICYRQRKFDPETPDRLCDNPCSPATSFRRGIIVAERLFQPRDRVIYATKFFKSTGDGTSVFSVRALPWEFVDPYRNLRRHE